MSDFSADDLEIAREILSRDGYIVYEARRREDSQPVRLTVFSSEVSNCAEFRRALKSNRAMLTMLQHQSVLRFLGNGEAGGQLYFWTPMTPFVPMSELVESGRSLSAEDIIEVGWQVCSALQQAHNLGLAHGGLSEETILLSESLQVKLSNFGVERWLNAARESMQNAAADSTTAVITVSTLASREEVEKDLRDLGAVLLWLFRKHRPFADADSMIPTPAMDANLERLLIRATTNGSQQTLVSAREFQGRLGEILIGTGEDVMPLVDHRESPGTSRRSIVVELFESPEPLERNSAVKRRSATSATWKHFLPIVILLLAVVIITLLAGLFR